MPRGTNSRVWNYEVPSACRAVFAIIKRREKKKKFACACFNHNWIFSIWEAFFFANILPTDTEGHKLIPNIKYTRAFLIIIKAKT